MTCTIRTHSESETVAVGRRMGAMLEPGDVVALTGDLGSGKTTLTKGIASGLGVESEVASPTFTLIHEHKSRMPLYHIDLYRIESEELVGELGLDEYLYGHGVTVIEWAERLRTSLPATALEVHLSPIDDTIRQIQLTASSPRWTVILQELTSDARSGD